MYTDAEKYIYRKPAEFLRRLIRFRTVNPPGEERDCITFLSHLLKAHEIETHLYSRDAHRPNLVARLRGRKGNAPLLLYGHVDVVPAAEDGWKYPPFEGVMADGCVWGRGALDMKGALVMMISAFIRAKTENLPLPGDVILCLLSDEENLGECGARFLVEQHPELFKGVAYAIGEFGGFSLYIGGRKFYPIEIAQKQKCAIKAIVRGPSAHGSSHVRGGTMARLARFLEKLDTSSAPPVFIPQVDEMFRTIASALPFPNSLLMRLMLNPRLNPWIFKLLGNKGEAFIPMFHNTVNASIIRGGEQLNVIPREVEVQLDVRLLPGQHPDDVLAYLRGLGLKDVEFEVLLFDRGRETSDMSLYETLAEILREGDPEGIPIPLLLTACTDARFFSRLGIQTYGFTPMLLPPEMNFNRLIHSENERIPVDALVFGTEALYKVLQRFQRY